MKKNNKILSSIALAGILATTALNGVVSATNGTKSVGVFKNTLVEGKTVVPYVSTVTVGDVKKEFNMTSFRKADGTALVSDSAKVGTGDVFTVGTQEHTVVVYGDLNADGKVGLDDIKTIISHVAEETMITDKVKLEAADVANDGKIGLPDITRFVNHVAEVTGYEQIIDKAPVPEKEPEVEYDYTMTINGNNIVNSVTAEANKSKIRVTPKQAVSKSKTYTVAVEVKGEDGNYTVVDITTNKIVTENKVTIEPSDNYKELDADFSHLDDGEYKVQLKDGEEIVAQTKVTVHKTIEVKASIIAKRLLSKNVIISSVDCYGSTDVVKMYCTVATSEPTVEDLVKEENALTITDNKLVGTKTYGGNTSVTQKVYYVLEDQYGSRTPVREVVIPSADVTNVQTVTVSEIKAETDENEFTVTLSENLTGTVRAILLKDGKAVEEADLTFTDAKSVKTSFASKITTIGKYTVKAYIMGTENTQPSDPQTSSGTEGTIEVSRLDPVTITYDNKNNKITWTGDVKGNYEIAMLYPQKDAQGKYTGKYVEEEGDFSKITLTRVAGKNEAVLSYTNDLEANVSYKVQVIATPTAEQIRKLPSEASTSKEFYRLDITDLSNLGFSGSNAEVKEKSITFTGLTPVTVAGSSLTTNYEVEIYQYVYTTNEEGTESKEETTKLKTIPVTLTKTQGADTYETTVTGLEAGNKYKFVLVAKVGDQKVATEQVDVLTTYQTPEKISGLKFVVYDATEGAKGKVGEISSNGTKARVNGKEITLAEYAPEYQAIFKDIVTKLQAGDKVTVTDTTIELVLNASGDAQLSLGDAINGKKVVIIGNGAWRTIKTDTVTGENKATEIVLQGENNKEALFVTGTTALKADKVTLNGVELNAGNGPKYALAVGTTNMINRVNVTAEKVATNITVGANTLTVDPSASNLTFVNYANADLTVAIGGTDAYGTRQTGNITVTSKEHAVVVSSAVTGVEGNINVTVENGTVTLTGDTLLGAQNVTLNNKANETTTITAKLEKNAPVDVTTLAIKDYTQTPELKDELLAVDGVTQANFDEVVAFMELFKGLNEKATITTDGTTVTLNITGEVANYTVPGLQK